VNRKSFILTVCVLLVASVVLVACGGGQQSENSVSLTAIAETQQADSSISTDIPATPETGLMSGAASCPDTFTEEFDASPDCWAMTPMVVTTRDADKINVSALNGKLVFDLGGKETYAYVFYQGGTYDKVVLQTTAMNNEVSDNGIALVCYANEKGWYEFRISNSGLFAVYRYDAALNGTGSSPYYELTSGGTVKILNGAEKSNTFVAICNGTDLGLIINDEEIWTGDADVERVGGMIGVGAMSYQKTNTQVLFENLIVSEP